MGIIYHIFNPANGRVYIGQTWGTLEQRWKQHCAKNSKCFHLKNAIAKYGRDRFIKTILTSGLATQEDMDVAERYWIGYFDSDNRESGYNLREGGSNAKHHKETKDKISKTMMGRKRSSEIKAKISAASRKRFLDPAEREKSRWRALKQMADPVLKAQNLAAMKVAVNTPEVRRKNSAAHGGKPFVCNETGQMFFTQSEAAQVLGMSKMSVCVALRQSKTVKGYSFRYAEEGE